MQHGDDVRHGAVPGDHPSQDEQDGHRDRRREDDYLVLPSGVDDALRAGIEHAGPPVRPEGHTRTRRGKQLEEEAVNEFVDGERRQEQRSAKEKLNQRGFRRCAAKRKATADQHAGNTEHKAECKHDAGGKGHPALEFPILEDADASGAVHSEPYSSFS